MIRELRRAHVRAAGLLLVVPPALLAVAVLRRAAEPRTPALPAAETAVGPPVVLAPEFPIRLTADWDSAAGVLRVGLAVPRPLLLPDPLVYWAPGEPGPDGTLPPGSRLLGAPGAGRIVASALADTAVGRTGRLVLLGRPGRGLVAITPVRWPLPEGR